MYDSSTLVSITSEEEQRFIEQFRKDQGIGTNYIWLGGRKTSKSGTWKWDDGSKYDYKNWSRNQDLGVDGLCMYLHTSDKWYDAKCENGVWNIKNFACKKIRKFRVD